MRRTLLQAIATTALAAAWPGLHAQQGAQVPAPAEAKLQPRISFHYENPRLQPASYTLVVQQDGTGYYKSAPGDAPPDDVAGVMPQAQEAAITISPGLLRQLFGYAAAHHYFATRCDSANDKIAFSGRKTLTYKSAQAQGSCTYDWARDSALNQLTDELESVAYTLEEGRRLSVELEHGRLSLDAELETLEEAAKDGRALELQNVAPQLEQIAGDEDVLQRARTRAAKLLKIGSAQAGSHQNN